MPATKIDQTTFDLGALQAEFTRGLYASAGVADLAVSTIREYVAEVPARVADVQTRVADVPARVQKGVTDVRESVKGIDFEPEVVRARAKKTFESIPNVASMPSVSETVEGLTALAKSRRTALKQRVTDLRGAREAVLSNVSAAAGTYEELVKRGESAVSRVRKGEPVESPAPVKDEEPVKVEEPVQKPAAPRKPAARKPAAAKKPAAPKKPAARKPAAPKATTAAKPAAAKKPAARKPAAPKATTAAKPAVESVATEKPADA